MDEKRFKELYDRAYQRGYKVFGEFMNMEEQSVLKETGLPCVTFGGFDMAERVVCAFGEDISKADFPISCLCVSPVSAKFSDALTHRDFLGALMNLGIKRETLGDIVLKNNCGYIFCLDKISDYIADHLTKVKHTTVSVRKADQLPDDMTAAPEELELIVSSCRLDVLVSAVYKLSRKEACRLFETGKIFVNSRQTGSPSRTASEEDILSVRGRGRFIFDGVIRKTKKDRLVVSVKKF